MKIFGAALEENRTITRIQMGKNNVLSQVACPPSHTIIHTNHSGKRGAGGRRSWKLPRKLLAKALSFSMVFLEILLLMATVMLSSICNKQLYDYRFDKRMINEDPTKRGTSPFWKIPEVFNAIKKEGLWCSWLKIWHLKLETECIQDFATLPKLIVTWTLLKAFELWKPLKAF